MQRATNYCSAQQSQSMSVSQSPDSVIASDDINVVNTNNNLNNNTVANPVVNQQQPNRVSLSPTNTRAPSITTTSQQQPPNRNTVVNPYLKQSPKNNNNTTHTIIDPILKKKQEFVDRYHLQALQHRGRNRVGGDSVKSISALELHTNSQNWRHSWQQQQLSCANNNQVVSNHTIPLRPRLFLFRRHAEQQKQNASGMQQQQQQKQQQPVGIWELDTGITELSGEGGSGKTQICLSTCVTCVMTPLLYSTRSSSGTGNSAPNTTATMSNTSSTQRNQQQNINHYTSIYITMGEGIPPASIARRLEQMVRTRLHNQTGDCNTIDDDTDNQVKDILSRIGLLFIRNEEEFVEFVEVDLPRILVQQQKQQQPQQRTNNPYLRQQQQQCTTQTTKIGLIAFDGIAGFFRFSDPTYQYSRNSMFHFQRSSKLLQISSQLRKLSNVFDVPILITNQVTASIPPIVAGGNGSSSFDMVSASMLATSSGGGYQRTLPALGLIWSNCVSTRFILQRKDGATFSLDDNVGNAEQQQNVQQSVAGGEKSQKQTMKKKREVRLRKARILQAVNMEKEEQEVWYVIDTGEVLAVG